MYMYLKVRGEKDLTFSPLLAPSYSSAIQINSSKEPSEIWTSGQKKNINGKTFYIDIFLTKVIFNKKQLYVRLFGGESLKSEIYRGRREPLKVENVLKDFYAFFLLISWKIGQF